jgi:hypothetical protein
MSGGIPPVPIIPSWHEQGQLLYSRINDAEVYSPAHVSTDSASAVYHGPKKRRIKEINGS